MDKIFNQCIKIYEVPCDDQKVIETNVETNEISCKHKDCKIT